MPTWIYAVVLHLAGLLAYTATCCANSMTATAASTYNLAGQNFNNNQQPTVAVMSHPVLAEEAAAALPARQLQAAPEHDCPGWMDEYANFHAKHRSDPEAKYLVFSIKHGSSGLGDRVRAMMFTVRLAAALDRVALFTWLGSPHEPAEYFPPAGKIDWRVDGTNYNSSDSETFRFYNWVNRHRKTTNFIMEGGLRNNSKKFITLIHNQHIDMTCAGCPDVAQPFSTDGYQAACLFNHLFKPSSELAESIRSHLEELFGPRSSMPGFNYVAMHLRLGGLEHENKLPDERGSGQGPLHDVIEGLRCARKLGDQTGVNTSEIPVLLITDNHELRSFIVEGGLANVVTPNLKPAHMARLNKEQLQSRDPILSTYIDLGLLANAHCIVYGRSGFVNTAWMLGGGKPCFSDLRNACRMDIEAQ